MEFEEFEEGGLVFRAWQSDEFWALAGEIHLADFDAFFEASHHHPPLARSVQR